MPLDLVPFQTAASPRFLCTRRCRPLRSFSRESPLSHDAQDYVDVDEGVLAADLGVLDVLDAASVLLSLFKQLQHDFTVVRNIHEVQRNLWNLFYRSKFFRSSQIPSKSKNPKFII